jgi:hypothetical protein
MKEVYKIRALKHLQALSEQEHENVVNYVEAIIAAQQPVIEIPNPYLEDGAPEADTLALFYAALAVGGEVTEFGFDLPTITIDLSGE